MNKEEWDELYRLRDKAALSPESDYRLASLEIYLSALMMLNLYSPDKIKQLNDQFKQLPEEERSALLSRIWPKTNSNLFHLRDHEVEKLRESRKELSFHERALISNKLLTSQAGSAWIDLGNIFMARIEIDDDSSPARGTRPYAYLYFSEGYRRRVETVDILESVRNNPAAIGHPAIAFAVHHWQRVVHARRVMLLDDVTTLNEVGKAAKEILGGGQEVRVAEANLKAIGEALIKGAKKRAVPKETALALRMQALGLGLKDKETVFFKAWELLDAKLITPTDTVEQVLDKIETELLSFERLPYVDSQNRGISTGRIMQFFRKRGREGGRRFVGFNRDGNSRRPTWKVFRNAFAAWFFELKQNVVQDYLEKAAKQGISNDEVYQPSWLSPKSNVFNVTGFLLTTPLVMAREPVIVHESDVGFYGLEKAVEGAADSDEEGEGN